MFSDKSLTLDQATEQSPCRSPLGQPISFKDEHPKGRPGVRSTASAGKHQKTPCSPHDPGVTGAIRYRPPLVYKRRAENSIRCAGVSNLGAWPGLRREAAGAALAA